MHANNWQFISKSFKNKKKVYFETRPAQWWMFCEEIHAGRCPGRRRSFLSSSHLTVGAAVVLGRDGALHGPRGWAAGQCRCREREREGEMEKQSYYQANQGPSPRRACGLSRKPRWWLGRATAHWLVNRIIAHHQLPFQLFWEDHVAVCLVEG